MVKLRVGLSRSLLDDVFGIFELWHCQLNSATCASKQIYGELVQGPHESDS